MPYDLMKTSLFSEEWCKGSNPHTAATNHLWLDRSKANPVHRSCKSFPVSCSLLLLAAASQCLVFCTALWVLQGHHYFAVLASSARPQHREISQGQWEGSPGAPQGSVPSQPGPSDTSVLRPTPCPSLDSCSSTTFCWSSSFKSKFLGAVTSTLPFKKMFLQWLGLQCYGSGKKSLSHLSFGASFIYLFCVDPFSVSVILLG